ncbi:MAG: Rpn family recombination-promoting nuclease/putative transposase [Thermoguttaceae bacterium]|nr:Rpn family recombination-promoting nuclease/putative transposase [Thermoguttaceae bacterium]
MELTDQNDQELDLFPEEAESSKLKLGLNNDRVFRAIFANEKNIDLLKILLNVVLKEAKRTPVKELRIRNPFQLGEWNGEKEAVLDVGAVDEEGREFDVEMQLSPHEALIKRIAYYGARLYSQQLTAGDPWSKLKPVVCIFFINFPVDKSASDVWFDVISQKSERRTGFGFQEITTIVVRLPKLNEWCSTPKKAFSKRLRNWVRILALYPRISRREVARLEKTTEGFAELRKKYTNYSSATWASKMVDAELARLATIREFELSLARKDREIEDKDRVIENSKRVIEDQNRALEYQDREMLRLVESQRKRLLKAIRNRFGVELANTPSYAEGKTAEELGDFIDSVYESASYEEFLASIENKSE